MNTAAILQAMRADAIPQGDAGLWLIRKLEHKHSMPHTMFLERTDIPDSKRIVAAGNYTGLFAITEATLMKYPGECVMEDSKVELSKHLEFIRLAHGNCLVSGLGLGCVVRGLMANKKVSHVTVLEKSVHVLRMVAPHMTFAGLTIRHADALKWIKRDRSKWDCAWNDCWTDESKDGHLTVLHQQLMLELMDRCPLQGAWHFPREVRRILNIKFGHLCRFI